MATKDNIPSDISYSSRVKKIQVLGPNGAPVSKTNPLPTDAVVSVDTMSLSAEMKVDSGHDLYLTENNVIAADGWVVEFDAVVGLDLTHIQAVENKTKGFVYNTKGATVTDDSITLVEANQSADVTEIETTDDVEIVYRGVSRFDDKAKDVTLTNKTQFTQLTDGTNDVTMATLSQGHNIHNLKGVPVASLISGRGSSSTTAEIRASGINGVVNPDISGNAALNTLSWLVGRTTANALRAVTVNDEGKLDVVTDVKTDVENLKMHSGVSVVMGVDQVLTADWVDTNNITTRDVSGYNKIGVFVEATPNDSENGQIRVVGELGSGNLYEIDGVSEKTVFTSGAAVKKYYEFDIGTLTNVRIQIKAGTVGATAGQMSVYLNEAYRY